MLETPSFPRRRESRSANRRKLAPTRASFFCLVRRTNGLRVSPGLTFRLSITSFFQPRHSRLRGNDEYRHSHRIREVVSDAFRSEGSIHQEAIIPVCVSARKNLAPVLFEVWSTKGEVNEPGQRHEQPIETRHKKIMRLQKRERDRTIPVPRTADRPSAGLTDEFC